ncbi:hypothetical protein O3S80_05885 [Streptomyces sp. Lzd4kr]|nr:hypothetical protein [Streptomyces sp. Lzd4kr]
MTVAMDGAGWVAAAANANSAPALGLAPDLARRLRWGRGVQDSVRTHPAQQLNGQVREQEGQAGHVVAGIDDDQEGRVADLPLA